MIREPTELDMLAEEQAIDDEPQPPVSKPRGRPPKPGSRVPFARAMRKKEEWVERPRPAWMSDPSLLPKRPPGR